MSTYFFLTAILLFCCFFAQKGCYSQILPDGTKRIFRSTPTNILLFIAIAALFTTSGLRYHVGTDYGTYVVLYSDYASKSWRDLLTFNEPILPFIAKIADVFFKSHYAMFFIASFVTIAFALYSTYRETTDYVFVTLLYFTGTWLGTFNGIRQYIAVTITYMGRKYIRTREFWKFLLVCFVAMLAHKSALFFILVYFAYSKEFSLKRLFIIVLAAVLISRNYDAIFQLVGWMNEAEGEPSSYAVSNVNFLRILVGCCPAILALYFAFNKKLDDEQVFYTYMLVANAAIRLATADSAYLARLSAYTGILVPLGLSSILNSCGKRYYSFFRVGIVILYFAFFLYEISNSQTLREFEWIFKYI